MTKRPKPRHFIVNSSIMRKTIATIIFLTLLVLYADEAIDTSSPALQILSNTLPAALLCLGLLGITRRFGISLLLCSAITIGLFAINSAKYEHIGQYLVFQDAFLAPLLIQGWDVFMHYTNLWAIAISIIILIFFVALGLRERPLPRLLSPLLLLTSLAGFYAISNQAIVSDTLYGNQAYDAKPWEANSPVQAQGLLVSLVSGARSANFATPRYDKEIITEFVSDNPHPPLGTRTPDIILWLGESYFDPGIIKGINTCDYIPVYCELANTGLTSAISVPTYGGNTTRTEFEVLTGIPFKLLGNDDYPYITTVHSRLDSIVWSLKAAKYNTVAIHPHDKTFWQRHRALPLLGFDTYLGETDIKNHQRNGLWISDQTLANEVVAQLQKNQKPTFIFAISMEGHGPFGNQKNLKKETLEAIKVPQGITGREARIWREYIYHAQHTMRAIEQLKDFIDQRERPTLIVFFGDHLPGLNALFDKLNFTDGENRYQQKTPALALANYPITSQWLPEFSYELGLWSLDLAGSPQSLELQQLIQATTMLHTNEQPALKPTIEAMQLRQLNPH